LNIFYCLNSVVTQNVLTKKKTRLGLETTFVCYLLHDISLGIVK